MTEAQMLALMDKRLAVYFLRETAEKRKAYMDDLNALLRRTGWL